MVVDSEGDVGKWPSMVHTGSELMIAYQDSANQDLKLARGSGTDWSIETIDSGDFRGADSEIFLNGSFPSIRARVSCQGGGPRSIRHKIYECYKKYTWL